ncbi:MAG: hypothetical protein ACRCX8_19595 [Sarcina sp.]
MIDFIKKLEIDESVKNALIVQFNDFKAKQDADYNTELDKFKDYDTIKSENKKLNKNIEQLNSEIQNKTTEHDDVVKKLEATESSWQEKYKDSVLDAELKTIPNGGLLKSQIDTSKLEWDENFKLTNGLSEQIENAKGAFPGVFEAQVASGVVPPARTDSNKPLTLQDIATWSQDKIQKNWNEIKKLY